MAATLLREQDSSVATAVEGAFLELVLALGGRLEQLWDAVGKGTASAEERRLSWLLAPAGARSWRRHDALMVCVTLAADWFGCVDSSRFTPADTLPPCTGFAAEAANIAEMLLVAKHKAALQARSTADKFTRLADQLEKRGAYANAERLYRRSLAIREKAQGPDHRQTATSLSNLAVLLQARGDLAGAEPLYRRALAIREKALGPNHPDTAATRSELAGLVEARGDLAGRLLCHATPPGY